MKRQQPSTPLAKWRWSLCDKLFGSRTRVHGFNVRCVMLATLVWHCKQQECGDVTSVSHVPEAILFKVMTHVPGWVSVEREVRHLTHGGGNSVIPHRVIMAHTGTCNFGNVGTASWRCYSYSTFGFCPEHEHGAMCVTSVFFAIEKPCFYGYTIASNHE